MAREPTHRWQPWLTRPPETSTRRPPMLSSFRGRYTSVTLSPSRSTVRVAGGLWPKAARNAASSSGVAAASWAIRRSAATGSGAWGAAGLRSQAASRSAAVRTAPPLSRPRAIGSIGGLDEELLDLTVRVGPHDDGQGPGRIGHPIDFRGHAATQGRGALGEACRLAQRADAGSEVLQRLVREIGVGVGREAGAVDAAGAQHVEQGARRRGLGGMALVGAREQHRFDAIGDGVLSAAEVGVGQDHDGDALVRIDPVLGQEAGNLSAVLDLALAVEVLHKDAQAVARTLAAVQLH